MRSDAPNQEPQPAASTLPSLAERVPPGRTVTAHSDITALLVFDHQMHGMNLLARAGWEVRVALADAPATASAVAARVAADLVDYLLFIDEAALAGPVSGDSGFAAAFAAKGPKDRAGRSLRDLDLATRLLETPVQLPGVLGGVRRPAADGQGRRLRAPVACALGSRAPDAPLRAAVSRRSAGDRRDPARDEERPTAVFSV